MSLFGGGIGSGIFSGGIGSCFLGGVIGGGISSGGGLGNLVRSSESIVAQPDVFDSKETRDFLRNTIGQSDSPIGFLTNLSCDIGDLVEDTRGEWHELTTDGVVEMLIKGNKNWKSSYEHNEETAK